LILDDCAMRELTSQQADDLYELMGERSRAGSMILTSNRSPQDWYPLFPNPVLAEGAPGRLLVRRLMRVVLRPTLQVAAVYER
jgi:DNA replication protein DnaC